MKLHNILLFLMIALPVMTSCSSDDDIEMPSVTPSQEGTFTDERDGYQYHWVRIGNLEWMTENSHYDLGDETKCKFYISYEDHSAGNTDDKYSQKYGFLYTLEGAKEAAPQGWRVPTDDDWKALEQALGMTSQEANATEWRGNRQADLLKQTDGGTKLGIQMAGYFTQHTIMATSGYRFMAVYGFYWTQTKDETKDGEFYYYRKLYYNSGKVYRQSMETTNQLLSVRFVRDAQS